MINDESNDTELKLKEFVEKEEMGDRPTQLGAPLTKTGVQSLPWQKDKAEISLGNQIGWQRLPISDLPTRGLFYPEGAEIAIRSATGAEIRHWSTLDENDLSALDDMLNYILERCATFKTPGSVSSWKDMKEVDRFYVLLAIREFTFIKGDNNLQVSISETKKMDVSKDMISFIEFDENLMERYDAQKRCFVLKFKNGRSIDVDVPSIGVTSFIKNYFLRKQKMQEPVDQDFIRFAPFVIREWRGLSDASYSKIVEDSNQWGITEISVLNKIRAMLGESVNPVIRYTDEGGMEHTAPLNFLGGIKSIFLISDPFAELA